MVAIDESYLVSGTLSPDVTGTYAPFGAYGGKNSYKLATGDWYIWWLPLGSKWIISAEVGSDTGARWWRADPNIEGIYTPQTPATGDATVTVIP